eukprot:1622457-Pyramimonas_sp.AAC.1
MCDTEGLFVDSEGGYFGALAAVVETAIPPPRVELDSGTKYRSELDRGALIPPACNLLAGECARRDVQGPALQ